MSKIDDIKALKRQQNNVTPSQAMSKEVVGGRNEENNVSSNVERKRVSFDLRTDLHQELKIQSVLQQKNIYLMIEEALMKYLPK